MESTGAGTGTDARIELVPHWDATLHYGLLRRESTERPGIFVGRTRHLPAITDAIADPQARGTFLISGYRGAGKTSLMVKAALDGKQRLEKAGWSLLSLVLNVSEISASLDSPGGPRSRDRRELHIDARHLLTALLRALRNELPNALRLTAQTPRKVGWWQRLRMRVRRRHLLPSREQALYERVVRASEKAEAATYEERRANAQAASTAEVRQRTHSVGSKQVLSSIAVTTGLASAALWGVWLFGAALDGLRAIALALAGVAVVSFQSSRSLTRARSTSVESGVVITVDNSLHQLESDLREILTDLASPDLKMRTIIVLEELDKIRDPKGHQLDSVIRYFKNLFTQAPALFFFVTDKAYYDFVARQIREARATRSYAIEHTFFTQRVFLGRPTTQECLEYLRQAIADERSRAVIGEIEEGTARAIRTTEDMKPAEIIVRMALFRSQDHLFDLKNELRAFLDPSAPGDESAGPRNPALTASTERFPEDDWVLASFHHLIDRFAEDFSLGPSQDYADEVLRDCLYSVFRDYGSPDPVETLTCFPRPTTLEGALTADQGTRIQAAVVALLKSLGAAEALEAPFESDSPTFRLRPSIDHTRFRPRKVLRPYEDEARTRLRELESHVRTIAANDVVGAEWAEPIAARLGSLRAGQDAIEDGDVTISASEAEALVGAETSAVDDLGREVVDRHVSLLHGGGIWLDAVDEYDTPTLFRLSNGIESRTGAVLVTYRRDERTRDAIVGIAGGLREHATRRRPRLAVVWVDSRLLWPERDDETEDWDDMLDRIETDGVVLASRTVLLGEGRRPPDPAGWEERTFDEVLLHELWTHQDVLGDPVPGRETTRWETLDSDGRRGGADDAVDLVGTWLQDADHRLLVVADAETTVGQLVAELCFDDRRQLDAERVVVPAAWSSSIWMSSRVPPRTPEIAASIGRLQRAGRVVTVDTAEETSVSGSDAEGTRITITDRLGPEHATTSFVVAVRSESLPAPYGPESPDTRLGTMVEDARPDLSRDRLRAAADGGDINASLELYRRAQVDGSPGQEQLAEEIKRSANAPAILHAARSTHDTARRRELAWAAADLGDAGAMYDLAGELREVDPEQATEMRSRLMALAADRSDEQATVLIGRLADQETDESLKGQMYEIAANNGDERAMAELATKSTDEATRDHWVRRLVDSSADQALVLLGQLKDARATEVALERVAQRRRYKDLVRLLDAVGDAEPEALDPWLDRVIELADDHRELVAASERAPSPEVRRRLLERAAGRDNSAAAAQLVLDHATSDPPTASDREAARRWLETLIGGGDATQLVQLLVQLDDDELRLDGERFLLDGNHTANARQYFDAIRRQQPEKATRFQRLAEGSGMGGNLRGSIG